MYNKTTNRAQLACGLWIQMRSSSCAFFNRLGLRSTGSTVLFRTVVWITALILRTDSKGEAGCWVRKMNEERSLDLLASHLEDQAIQMPFFDLMRTVPKHSGWRIRLNSLAGCLNVEKPQGPL